MKKFTKTNDEINDLTLLALDRRDWVLIRGVSRPSDDVPEIKDALLCLPVSCNYNTVSVFIHTMTAN